MIVGNPVLFALESNITVAYERLSHRALGFFVIHVGGQGYGVRAPDATLLACSFDEVSARIARRGTHVAPMLDGLDAGRVADTYLEAVYSETQNQYFLGIDLAEFSEAVRLAYIVWAPDGDEAFDDGSFVLQIDREDRVRLIAFKRGTQSGHEPASLREISLAGDEYYRILKEWRDRFLAEWASAPKGAE